MPHTACLVLACGCGGPAPPSGPQPVARAQGVEACARELVERELVHPIDVSVRRINARVVAFAAMYGEAHDCEAGCFYSHAIGIALSCERIGWIAIDDYERTSPRDFSRFELQPGDAILLDEALWNADRPFAKQSLLPWLVRNPSTPAEVRARAERWSSSDPTGR